MHIKSIRIKNFRSFKDETISFDDYVCLVGPNGGGKSNVLSALNVFFRNSEGSATDVLNLVEEDFHHKNTEDAVEITVVFSRLSAEAQDEFSDYYRHGELVVSAVAEFDYKTKIAPVNHFGQRTGMTQFKIFFEAEKNGATAKDLRETYESLRAEFSDLPNAKVKKEMTDGLHEFERNNLKLCEQIPSQDHFYGASKGSYKMEKYLQWVYIPAVKDVTKEQSESKDTALGKILDRTVRQSVNFDEQVEKIRDVAHQAYTKLLSENKDALISLEQDLGAKLATWATPQASVKINWRDGPKSVQVEHPTAFTKAGESGFEGDLARSGSGFQRSYLLAMLQILASSGHGQNVPRLILGCEEPELYQHPPQRKHLSSVLEQLAENNTQVIITTHEPAFVSGKGFESVRLIRYDDVAKKSSQSSMTFDKLSKTLVGLGGQKPTKPKGLLAKLHQTLQPAMSEIFFTKKLILVEGLEDVAIITSWMMLTGRWEACRQNGIHIVPTNGKSHMVFPLAISKEMNIPTYAIFDADGGEAVKEIKEKHALDNKALLGLLGGDVDSPFPEADIAEADYVAIMRFSRGVACKTPVLSCICRSTSLSRAMVSTRSGRSIESCNVSVNTRGMIP